MAKKILLVDDEIQLLSLLSDVLENEGFETITARNGEDAINLARQLRPDMVILDIMMSKMDGYECLKLLRREYDIPVIMLTAKVEEIDKVLGFKLGADDYVTKPFSPKELVARVHAVLRRAGPHNATAEILKVADVTLDYATRIVTIGKKEVDLTRSEFDLLAILLAAPGRVFSRSELLEKLQGAIVEGYERTVDVHIKNLRAKIEPDPANPIYIETVYGVGYRFNRNSGF